jgi:hypothetical protein
MADCVRAGRSGCGGGIACRPGRYAQMAALAETRGVDTYPIEVEDAASIAGAFATLGRSWGRVPAKNSMSSNPAWRRALPDIGALDREMKLTQQRGLSRQAKNVDVAQ